MQATLHPSGAVEDQVGATHDRPPQGEHALVPGLRVDGVGGTDVGASIRDAVAAGELAAEHRRLHELWCAERRRARLHIDIAGETAVHDRCASADELGEGDAGERLGVLLHDRTGDRHRRHRTGEGERGENDRLITRRVLENAFRHRDVEAERRADVDDRVHDRVGVDLVLGEASDDAHHFERVEVALGAERVDVHRLIGEREDVAGGLKVTDRRVEIDRFDRIAGVAVKDVEALGQFQQRPVVLTVTDAPTALAVGVVGSAGDGGERDIVATDHEVVRRIGRVHRELARHRRDQLGDELGVEADPFAVDLGAGLGPHLEGGGVEEVHPCVAQYLQRGEVNRLEFVIADHPGRFHRPLVQTPRNLLRPDGAGRPFATTAPTTPTTGLGGVGGRVDHDASLMGPG